MPQSLNPFASAEPVKAAGDPGKVTDVLDFLSSDKEPEVKEEKKELVKDDDKKDDKKDEDEIKLKGEDDELPDDEEKLDLKTDDDESSEEEIKAPPRIKDIEKKYPELFKDFPFLSKMMARDKYINETFGSFDELKEVASKVEQADAFEAQLLSGDTKDVLKTVKNTDPKAFDKIVDNYLPALEAVDKDAYMEVCGNFVKRIIMGMSQRFKASGDEELKATAEGLHKYIFGDPITAWQDPKLRVAEEKSDANKELDEARSAFVQERFEVARDDLQSRVDNTLKSTIEEYIDPKGLMSAYEKRNAVKESLDMLHGEIAKDQDYRKTLNKLWRASSANKFSKGSLDEIRKSYLGKSKGLLATVIKKVRAEALKDKDVSKDTKKEEKEEPSRERKNPITAGRPQQQNKDKAKNERQKGETVEEFLARD